MAIKTIKTFSTLDKKFDPETTLDKSTDNMLFNATQVETAYNVAKSKAEAFITKMSSLGSQISKIGNAGLKGTTITQAISSYNSNVQKVATQITTAKGSFTKAVESKLEQLSSGEKSAAGLAAGAAAGLGQTASNVKDAVMDVANDIISWAKQGIDSFDPSMLGPISKAPGVQAVTDKVGELASNAWDKVTDVASDAWDAVSNFDTSQLGPISKAPGVQEGVTNIVNTVVDTVSNFDPSQVVTGVQNAGQAVVDTASNVASNVSDWVSSITPW